MNFFYSCRVIVKLLFLNFLLLNIFLSAAYSLERDFKYIIRKDSQNIGKITIRKSENRNFIIFESKQELDLKLFLVKQKFTEFIKIKYNKKNNDRKISIVSNSLFKKRSVEIEITGNSANITAFDLNNKKKIILKSKKPIYFETDYFLINKNLKLKEGKIYRFNVVDTENFSLDTISCKLIKINHLKNKKTEYTFKIRRKFYTSIERYDENFDLIEEEIPRLSFKIESVSVLKNKRVNSFNLNGNMLLEIPINVKYKDRYGIKSSMVNISFYPDELKKLKLNYENQHVLSEEIDNDRKYISIRVDSISQKKDFDVKISQINIDGYKLFLKPTVLILSNSKKIESIIEKLNVGKNESLDTVVNKIVGWINSHINQEIIPDKLNSDEIIKLKRGMCMQYSILFAAISRKLGIPTRCCFGEVYINKKFMPHMYNEVFNGKKWLFVDSTREYFSHGKTDPLLLKFSDGLSLNDISETKIKLINNLKVEDVKIK